MQPETGLFGKREGRNSLGSRPGKITFLSAPSVASLPMWFRQTGMNVREEHPFEDFLHHY